MLENAWLKHETMLKRILKDLYIVEARMKQKKFLKLLIPD